MRLVCACGKIHDKPNFIQTIRCSCGNYLGSKSAPKEPKRVVKVAQSDYEARQQICMTCQYLSTKGCVHYIRPCTVKQLWADQIDPPEKCPRKEQFE